MNPTLTAPLDFERVAAPAEAGMTESGIQRIRAVFADQLARGLHPGAQLVVLRQGRVAVDLAGGWGRVRPRGPVTRNTPFLAWSCTKALTGMCMHRLIEAGQVAWDAPIADYWPEFGCKGKEPATIRHAFLHQAGIPTRGLYTQWLLWPNWKLVTRNVAGLQAEWVPGTRTAYHTVNYGFILGEVVRRVTGLPIQEYLRQHFTAPLGMDHSWLGLPRAATSEAAAIYCGDRTQRLAVMLFNVPAIRRAVIPAATLNTNARGLAVFYQMLLNGGEYAGRRYVRPATIATATMPGYEGYDATIGIHVRWAHGFHLGGVLPENPPGPSGMGLGATERTFGHFGQASCMAWADPDAGLVVVFLCNRLLGDLAVAERWAALSNAVWDALA